MLTVTSTWIWVFAMAFCGIVWNYSAATANQLHTFPSRLGAFSGARFGVIFVANCNDSICLKGINLANNTHRSMDLGGAITPSILGFLGKKLYLGYSDAELDYLLAIDFSPACKWSKCPATVTSVNQPLYKLELGAMDTIGERIFLFYHAIDRNNSESTRMCIYAPRVLGIDCIFDFDSTLHHAVFDSMSSALYYTACYSGKCKAFRLALDVSTGFPKLLGQPENLHCISNKIATPVLAKWYEYSYPAANLYFPAKPSSYVYTWNARLNACLPSSKPKLDPETSAVLTSRSYTVILLPNDTMLVRSPTHRHLLRFDEKIHLLTTLSYDNDYRFDKNCLVAGLLSPEVVVVPIYQNVARVNVRRPHVEKISSLEDYFRSKCQNISLPHFALTVAIKPVGALDDRKSNDSTQRQIVYDNGIVELIGLQLGQQYTVTVYWANKYTRERRLEPVQLSQRLNWTADTYPEVTHLALAPTDYHQ